MYEPKLSPRPLFVQQRDAISVAVHADKHKQLLSKLVALIHSVSLHLVFIQRESVCVCVCVCARITQLLCSTQHGEAHLICCINNTLFRSHLLSLLFSHSLSATSSFFLLHPACSPPDVPSHQVCLSTKPFCIHTPFTLIAVCVCVCVCVCEREDVCLCALATDVSAYLYAKHLYFLTGSVKL